MMSELTLYQMKFIEQAIIGAAQRLSYALRTRSARRTFLLVWLTVLIFWAIPLCSPCLAQISPVGAAIGNELTQMKITVSRNVINEEGGNQIKTLPINEVSILEAGDTLSIQFCERCPGRRFSDLGFRRMLVFFINPASAENDLKSNNSVNATTVRTINEIQENNQLMEKVKTGAIAEVKFDNDFKSRKNLARVYSEHQFKVPYRSIPLIFLVSDGDYRNELRKTILEKQADVLKLSEQATLISQLPEAVSFLLQVKTALQTQAIYNTDIAQSLVQRAQIFRFNQTNCFQQTFLYRTDQDKLGCLAKNVNPDQLTSDIQNFSLNRFGQIGGAEAVAQLRSRYQNLNIFFDAASAAIEIIGRVFQKKPINIQLATLQSLNGASSATGNNLPVAALNPSQQTSSISSSWGATQVSATALLRNSAVKNDYLSLRQYAVNSPINTEKALIIAPLKWRENNEIIQPEDLQAVDSFPDCNCLHSGKNIFWLDSDNALVRQEVKTAAISLQKKDDSSQKRPAQSLPINPADGSLTLLLDDSDWQKVKDWRETIVTISLANAFNRADKIIDLKVPQKANWQLMRNWNEPVKKGTDIVLKIASNTEKRECLNKIILTDEKKQSVQLSPIGEYSLEKSGILKLNLTTKLLDKLQAGKIAVEIYENGEATASGKINFTLAAK